MTHPYGRMKLQTRRVQAPTDQSVLYKMPQHYDLFIMKVTFTLEQTTLIYCLLAYDAVQFATLITKVSHIIRYRALPIFRKYNNPYTMIKNFVSDNVVPIHN
jgi:hypothetical protein